MQEQLFSSNLTTVVWTAVYDCGVKYIYILENTKRLGVEKRHSNHVTFHNSCLISERVKYQLCCLAHAFNCRNGLWTAGEVSATFKCRHTWQTASATLQQLWRWRMFCFSRSPTPGDSLQYTTRVNTSNTQACARPQITVFKYSVSYSTVFPFCVHRWCHFSCSRAGMLMFQPIAWRSKPQVNRLHDWFSSFHAVQHTMRLWPCARADLNC